MSTNNPSNVAVESPTSAPESVEARLARMEQALAESEARRIAAETDAEALRKAGTKPTREAFVPVVQAVLRPRGWYAPGTSESFASSEPHVAVTLQRYAAGKAKWISGGQSGFTLAQLEAILGHAEELRAMFASA